MNTATSDLQDVAIVGAGIIGATVACALGQQGLHITIIEAREPELLDETESDYDLRVLAVSPGSEMILRALGAWDLVELERVCPYRQMQVWDAGGGGEITFDCLDVNEPRLGYIVENRAIQNALIKRMNALEEFTWRCPDALSGFAVDDDGVTVELESGARVRARLLVGADGPRSRVRKLAGIVFRTRDYDQCALIANVATERSHNHTARQRFLADGVLAFLPLADGRSSIVWSTLRERAQYLASLPDARFCEALAEAFDFRLGNIESCGPRAVFPLRGGQAEPYVLPRVALIGDAAHGIHPLAGQGANLGFMDAAALADVLTDTGRDIGSLRVLRRYERARKGDNIAMMLAMEGFRLLFGHQTLPLRYMRNLGLSLTDAAAPVKRQLIRYAMGLSGERPRLARGYL
jgi:2-polyprenylphenol 6-hydroxylase